MCPLKNEESIPRSPLATSSSHWPQMHSMYSLSHLLQEVKEGHVWLEPISIHPRCHGQNLSLHSERESS